MAQADCIIAQMNWLPTQVNKFTLPKKKNELIPTRSLTTQDQLPNELVPTQVESNKTYSPPTGCPNQIGLFCKEKAQTEGEICSWCAHQSNFAYNIRFINLQHKRIHKTTNKQTGWTGYQSG